MRLLIAVLFAASAFAQYSDARRIMGYPIEPGTGSMEGLVFNSTTNVWQQVGVQPMPTSESAGKVIVIAGSSVADGVGASGCATAAFGCNDGSFTAITSGLFPAAMVAKGYTVYNTSVSGRKTADVISNFYTEVAPLKPNFVIHSTGIGNETSINLTTYRANILRLIKMTEQIGAIPVVIGPYALNVHTAASWRDALDLYQWLELLDVQVWDLADATVEPGTNGDFIAAYDSGDGAHPNDAGHAALYSAIPITYFDTAYSARGRQKLTTRLYYGSWEWGSDTTQTSPLLVTTDRSFASFTAGAWFYGDTSPHAQANIVMMPSPNDSAGDLRVRCGADNSYVYELKATGMTTIVSATECDTAVWNHVAVVFNAGFDMAYLYINGELVADETLAESAAFTAMTWLGNSLAGQEAFNCTGCRIAEPFLYRAPLTAESIKQIYLGQIPRRSLEFLGNTIAPVGGKMANYADTTNVGVAGTYSSFTAAAGKATP